MSSIVNDAVKTALSEDADDIVASENRSDEALINFSDMVQRLKEDGRI